MEPCAIMRNIVQWCAVVSGIVRCCARSCSTVQQRATLRGITQQYPIACDIGQHQATLCNIVQYGTRKSIQNRFRDTQNRDQISPGRLSRRPVASKSILQASREHLGTSPARPRRARRVPKGGPGHQKDRLGGLGSVLRRPKSTPSRARKRKQMTFCAQLVHEASLDQLFVNFALFSIRQQSLRTLESTAPASKNKDSALRAASRVAHAL